MVDPAPSTSAELAMAAPAAAVPVFDESALTDSEASDSETPPFSSRKASRRLSSSVQARYGRKASRSATVEEVVRLNKGADETEGAEALREKLREQLLQDDQPSSSAASSSGGGRRRSSAASRAASAVARRLSKSSGQPGYGVEREDVVRALSLSPSPIHSEGMRRRESSGVMGVDSQPSGLSQRTTHSSLALNVQSQGELENDGRRSPSPMPDDQTSGSASGLAPALVAPSAPQRTHTSTLPHLSYDTGHHPLSVTSMTTSSVAPTITAAEQPLTTAYFGVFTPIVESPPFTTPSTPTAGPSDPRANLASYFPAMDDPSSKSVSSGTEGKNRFSSSSHAYPPSLARVPSSASASRAPNRLPSLHEPDPAVTEREGDGKQTGRLGSRKGVALMIVTGTAQMLDNILLTSVNIALPAICKELNIAQADTSWLMSAYALAFVSGDRGFLLLAGVLSDRYGRKRIFELGMAWLTLWTLAVSFAPNEVSVILFRAMQGLGAAATVPSAVGIISAFFVGKDRNTALCYFGAFGAVGFSAGLIFGGIVTSFLSWRYIFRLSAVLTGLTGIAGQFVLPTDKQGEGPKPALDFLGAGLGTGGLVLLVFCLSSGGVYGWGKAFLIVLLVLSVLVLFAFTLAEKKVKNPIMPLSLWKAPNFAVAWVCGLLLYTWWQAEVYYMVLMAQNVYRLSAIETALRFLPMGVISFPICVSGAWFFERFQLKKLIIFGMIGCVLAPVPAAVMHVGDNFWSHLWITSIIGVIFISFSYACINLALVSSVPPSAKGLAGGLANTAYQLGSGIGLAVTAAVQQGVSKKLTGDPTSVYNLLQEYKACLWTTSGMAGVGVVLVVLFLKEIAPVPGAVTTH